MLTLQPSCGVWVQGSSGVWGLGFRGRGSPHNLYEGLPKLGIPLFSSILGSILGSPYLGKVLYYPRP